MSNPFAVSDGIERSVFTKNTIKLKRVGVISLGLFLAAGAFVTSAVVCFLMLIVVVAGMMNESWQPAEILALFFAPILYAILGFAAGAFYAIVYNVIAGMTGGIELEIENK
ncbi:MAG: hypothetical protein JNM43_03870 [Planctomycetaceae bacterium]|nr:hypothetical protein [Planctomycetaceae bacterium]